MRCLCCQKDFINLDKGGWCQTCIKKFFGTSKMPIIDLNEEKIKSLVENNVKNHLTIPGVQKKLSLTLSSFENTKKLTLVNYMSGYILKPQVEEFECLPEAEFLTMTLAQIVGIKTVPNGLIKLENNTFAYITKRIDRVKHGKEVKSIAMEDFCQLSERATKDKYHSSYEQCAKIIDKYSENKLLDKVELFYRILFFYITGNSDMHLKNFSLIKKQNYYCLSNAYDLVPVKTIMPEDEEDLALTLNGKKRHIRRGDFYKFGLSIGLSKITIENMIKKIISFKDKLIEATNDSNLTIDQKENLIELIDARINELAV